MNQISGVVDYLKFFPQGRISFEYLINILQDADSRLIFVATRAAGREGGMNVDVYCAKKYIVPPDIYKKEDVYCPKEILDCTEEVYSFWRNPLTKEELLLMIQEPFKMEKIIVLDCGSIHSQEDLRLMVEENLFSS